MVPRSPVVPPTSIDRIEVYPATRPGHQQIANRQLSVIARLLSTEVTR